ncbi:MAG: CBS domain-containing protein [Pseudomonadales bacterium]
MKKEPRIKQLMTPFPHAIERGAGVLEARKLMLEHRIRHLPVMHNHELVGLISDRDIKLMLGPEFDYPSPRDLSVDEVMVENPYVVDLDTALRTVLRHMADAHIGTALVTKSGRLAGIFTATDACRHFAEWLEHEFPPPSDGTDAA